MSSDFSQNAIMQVPNHFFFLIKPLVNKDKDVKNLQNNCVVPLSHKWHAFFKLIKE